MDTAIKQRILGGLVLVTGAAIFLPLMLDGSGARLLSRLDPTPARPAVTTAPPAALPQPAEVANAGQAVADAHEGELPFYPVGGPAPDAAGQGAAGVAPPPAQTAPPATIAKTPEQLAAEEAARQRANQLLASPDGISPEEAARQQKAEEKLAHDMSNAAKAAPGKSSLTDDGARAKAILEARNADDPMAVEQKLRPEPQKPAKPVEKTVEKPADKARADAQATKAKADAAQQEEKARADKLVQEKADARKAEELAKAKAEKARLDQAKAQAALEGKKSEKAAEKDKADKSAKETAEKSGKDEKAKSGGWIVQVASVSAREKADALSAKLRAKGYRAQVVRVGDAWKVVVGPELQKDAAKNLSSKLNGESGLGVSGAWVAPWKP